MGTSKHDVEVQDRDIAALGDPLAEAHMMPPRTAAETVAPISSQPRIRLSYLLRLIYSAFLFIEPIQRKSSPYWLRFCAVYACFLILYFALLRSKTKLTSLILLVLIGILGLVYFPSNGGALVLFIFVLSFAPQVVETLKACAFIFGAVCLAMAVEGTSFRLNPWLWAFGSVFAVAIGAGNLIIEQQRRSNHKLHLAHEDIERLAKIAERDRIARDLHDVLGHTLSVIVLKSELAGKVMSRDVDQSHKEITEVEHIARTALKEVREAIRGYRADGLVAEIARARTVLQAAGVSLDCDIRPMAMRPADETILSLVLREAVTNIVRHSGASTCRVEFQKGPSSLNLNVQDNGRGQIREEGNGLRGTRERVQSIGGTMTLNSERGTRLEISLPVNS